MYLCYCLQVYKVVALLNLLLPISSPSNCGSLGANTYFPEEIKVIVEPLDKWPHHSALEVTPGLINSAPAGSTCHITVELTNHSAQLVLLPPKVNLASFQVALEVYEAQNKSKPAKRLTSI